MNLGLRIGDRDYDLVQTPTDVTRKALKNKGTVRGSEAIEALEAYLVYVNDTDPSLTTQMIERLVKSWHNQTLPASVFTAITCYEF